MKYKGFNIKRDYANDIIRKDEFGEYDEHGGYRCRIYDENDKRFENILAIVELAYGSEISYRDTEDDEVDGIMKYIDSNENFLNRIKDEIFISSPLPKSTVFAPFGKRIRHSHKTGLHNIREAVAENENYNGCDNTEQSM